MIDAHLDLAWSALYFNRDLLGTIAEMRESESGLTGKARGCNTVSLPELRRARVPICIATVLARSGPDPVSKTQFQRTDLDYRTQAVAHGHAKGQLAYYKLLEAQGHMKMLRTRGEFRAHFDAWLKAPETTPIGYVLSMEGGDPIIDPDQVKSWWDDGLRAVGPAHYGRSQYAYGTATDGRLTEMGVKLLKEFMRIGMILDVTHLSDQSFFHAMEVYEGPLLASHHNCRALVPGDRQFSDEQLRVIIKRGGVIGAPFDAWMIYPGWVRGVTKPEVVSLEDSANHIDHICQLAGNTRHCAIGTDLDGGFGTEQTPRDLNTITDVHKLEDILARRGYSSADIDGIFFGNWLRFFGEALPK